MVWGGYHGVVVLTVVSGVERDAWDECGVGAELSVLSVIVPCSTVCGASLPTFLCLLYSLVAGGPEGLDTTVMVG